MTTSFSLLVRGDLPAAFRAQPFGAVAGVAAGMTVWAAGYIAITGRPVHRLFRRCSATWLVGILLGAWLISWGWKIFVVVGGLVGG